jgi:hypothetical protein
MRIDPQIEHPLRPLVDAWTGKIDRARHFKKPWQEVADECMAFFSESAGFLWDPKNRAKFFNANEGAVDPTFKVTVAKAFELVALFGPSLYWRNPKRTATAREFVQVPPEFLAQMMGVNNPQALMQSAQAGDQAATQQLMAVQQQMQKDQQEGLARQVRAELMRQYLNYTPGPLGLATHSEDAITEALVKGRGCLWTEPYRPPGSDKPMVGSFWYSSDYLFIDPDADSLDEAWWIARECWEPAWKVEQDRGYPEGFLSRAGTLESANAQGHSVSDSDASAKRSKGESLDLIQYWKVWSRTGIGTRLKPTRPSDPDQYPIHPREADPVSQALERTVGNYCYIEVTKNIQFPLNMPSRRFKEASTDDIRRAFRWPVPYWRKGQWPVAVLDFYRKPKSPWPVGPMVPGLGELKAINIIISHLVNRIWMSSRDFIAILASAKEELEKKIREGKDLTILFLDDQTYKNISEVIQFLQQPQVNKDVWTILGQLFELFDRRVGLTELLYGLSGRIGQGQIRSATDAQIRQSNVSIRPKYMASKVEEWQSQIADREAFAAKWYVDGRDVADVLGPTGGMVWEQFISKAPVERVVFDIDYRIAAGSAARPNHERDVSNLNEALGFMLPAMVTYGQLTGNFQSIEWIFHQRAKAAEMDASGVRFPPPQPQQPDQGEQQQLQQQMQIQQAEHQAEQQQKGEVHRQDMTQDQERHEQEMTQRGQEGDQKLRIQQAQNRLQRLKGNGKAAVR